MTFRALADRKNKREGKKENWQWFGGGGCEG